MSVEQSIAVVALAKKVRRLKAINTELLKALKKVNSFHQYDIDDEHLEDRRKTYIKAMQAIAKAEKE